MRLEAPQRSAGDGASEQVVLLEFKEPEIGSEMEGMEAAWRSANVAGIPQELFAPRSDRCLTVKFAWRDEAA